MKYESAILKRLIETYGVVGNPHYISEIIKEFIVQGKERFPDLFTYQSDWLAHIDDFGLNPSYTVSYTGQSIYAPNTLEKPVKSAILKGSTKYRDIDTGEFLETFEEDRNLELVSVKMPVLKTVGKNLFNRNGKLFDGWLHNGGSFVEVIGGGLWTTDFIETKNESYISFSGINSDFINFVFFDGYYNNVGSRINNVYTVQIPMNAKYIRITFNKSDTDTFQIEYGNKSTSYEPYKSNILTVNEDVTLRSNGDICDELNLLARQLTQRIGEDGVVLSQEVVKTVGLTILDQNGQNVKQLMSFNGGTHFITGSSEGLPLPLVSVSVETDLEETLKVCSLEGNTL